MDQIVITHLDSSTLLLQSRQNSSTILSAVQKVDLMGNDTIDIAVQSGVKLPIVIGDKITIIGREYTLNTPARERKIAENLFEYTMQFEGVQYDMLRVAYNVNVSTSSSKIQDTNGDSVTGDMTMFLNILIANMNRVFSGKWSLGTVPATEARTESFSDSDNCLSALQSLCSPDKFNQEFSIAVDGSGNKTLNIGVVGSVFPFTFQYGKSKGMYELVRERMSSSNIVTRLNAYGSSRNINTSKYRASRLCLPTKSKAQSYLEDATAITKYGIWEGTKMFEDIYPHRTGTVSAVDDYLNFRDSSMDFDLNAKDGNSNSLYLIPGTSAKIHFNTGQLAGYEFEVSAYSHSLKKFTLLSMTDQNGYTFPSPSSSAFQFAVGDKYVMTDIYMPQSYLDTAEAALQTAATAYLAKYSSPVVQYSLSVDSQFLKSIVGASAQTNIIWPGDSIPILDTDIDVNKTIRVKGITRDLIDEFSYQLTIAEQSLTVSTISRVISELNSVDKVIKTNLLNDPARAKRNFLSAQEVLNMVFDPEGDFYTSKIKPLSIDTTMLSVGAKSMQFGLLGTIFQVNYGGAKNRIVYTGGTLTHYSVLDTNGDPRIWTITDGDVTLSTDAAYYIYAKCAKAGSGAVMYFSATKILVDSDSTYYHFLLGVVNSVDSNNARALALMYGFTTVNGRFIKTGRIQSADGATYFDLDAGEFKGSFKFSSGVSVETAVNNANTTAAAAAAAVSDLDYLKTALAGSTDISGGLLATNVLLMKTAAGAITGGMSGVNSDNIGMWAGGTYAEALSKLAKIIMRKDGSGQLAGGKINWDAGGGMNIGLFSIFSNLLSSGNISFTSDSLEDLTSIQGSDSSVSSPGSITAYNQTWVSMQSSQFSFTRNTLVKFRVNSTVRVDSPGYAYLQVMIYDSTNTMVWNSDEGHTADTGTNSYYWDYSVNLPAGTYYVKVMAAVASSDYCYHTAEVVGYGGSGYNITLQPISALTKIANNGFYSFWGSSAYLYLRTDFGFQVMFGSYGIQCKTGGLKKTYNGGSTWTTI